MTRDVCGYGVAAGLLAVRLESVRRPPSTPGATSIARSRRPWAVVRPCTQDTVTPPWRHAPRPGRQASGPAPPGHPRRIGPVRPHACTATVRAGVKANPSLRATHRADGPADVESVPGPSAYRGTVERTVAVLTLDSDEDVDILAEALAPERFGEGTRPRRPVRRGVRRVRALRGPAPGGGHDR